PIFFYLKLSQSATGNAFDWVVTPSGAVVVMDNVPAHKVKEIEPLIQSVGASVLYQSPPES
ncbi:hypothetical protein QUA71_28655, partial [Microcoleus sp. MON1_C5]